MIFLYKEASRRTGKDADAIRIWIERRAMFSDLIEMALDGDDAIGCLCNLVRGVRGLRNRRSKCSRYRR